MSSSASTLLTLLSIALTTVTLLKYLRGRNRLPLPPGPPKWPILGNILQIPSHKQSEVYHSWATEYKSDVVHVSAAGLSILIVDTAEAAAELLEKRSLIYSSRPRLTMLNELIGWKWALPFLPYGDAWKRQRMIFHKEFTSKTIAQFRSHELYGSHSMLQMLLRSPKDFRAHIKLFAGSLILLLAYGIEINDSNDPLIVTAERAVETISLATIPGRFLVDSFPVLRYMPSWLPFASFKRSAAAWRVDMDAMLNKPFDMTKKLMLSSTAISSIASRDLYGIESASDREVLERDLKELTGSMYVAGSDTTVSTLESFFLEMTRHPDIQAEAQREIDQVVGDARLPDFSDEQCLPYVTAILKEVLRLNPVAPCGGIRELMADDIYQGFRVPKGSIVVANTWAILHDPVEYPEPFGFNPGRFLKNGRLNLAVKDPATAAFGYGRRVCPARQMAMSSMWIAIASTLACLNIRKTVDDQGAVIEPSGEYTSGILVHRLPLPPGPPRWPIIANLFQVPIHNRAEVFHIWSTKYKSDVIYLSAAGLPILVLDTADAAIELLEKRSSIYSSRPRLIMLNKLIGWEWSMPFLPYGDAWRRQRKIFHQEFNRSAIAHFKPHELAGSRMMLHNLLRSPQGFEAHIKHFAGYLILLLAYGIEAQASDDPLIVTAERAMDGIIVATLPGRFLVDFIPLLRYVPSWFPFADFKRLAAAWRLHMNDALNKSFGMAKKSMSSSSPIPSVTSRGLEAIEAEDGQGRASMELDLQKAVGSMYIGGSDTTVSSLMSFFLEMTRRPDIQERAQREIDAVVGSDRLPSFDDEDSLPYVTALLKEILRFNPVAPCAGLRELTADDVYKGYHMPTGSVVLVNAWAILHDPIEYPEPERFNPDRFLKDGKLNLEVKDPATAAFGFGRRICPARHMAMSSMWIAMVSILASFDIRKAVDEQGAVIEPSGEYTSGIVTQPLPFKCSIRPRSPKHAALIMA